MDDPVKEIEDVVRSITEPYEASVIADNIEKYFTRDAQIFHPFINQPYSKDNGREDLKGIYKILRVQTIDNKIDFHAVMFNEDKTQGTIELTEHVCMRMNPLSRLRPSRASVRFLVRIDLKKCEDGKYRIYRQEDNFPSDLTQSGFAAAIPGMGTLNTIIKSTAGYATAKLGRFFLAYGWFGP
ncbi:uncharacterized protein MELLADRAFT_76617 [Melampsora larici-populina 98AG31]|uniref:SigF-like NTF2-like domain-containing protein n=1 Tax=Melampsora larici-populina (strain 98AG31 / pathotype 3-4-7) TaxID=747676 RepID=F4R7H5_MELLP|nr:uncharacterized protein MELLADRAFT_76617 [Melampsora larici-populina 98AG31]EGG11319.1 hypothetical protein MELLADRAFT_76617 [Melampsora larici-populina 98AG31]